LAKIAIFALHNLRSTKRNAKFILSLAFNLMFMQSIRFGLLFVLILLMTGCRGQGGHPPDPIVAEEEKPSRAQLLTGAEQTALYFQMLEGKKVGVTGNQTSLVGSVHLVDTMLRSGLEVVKVYCPEHGFRGEAEAGKAIQGGKDPLTGLPVISLYGKKKKPSPEDLAGIEVMVFDIQDVGARFYTYISTLHYVMEACAEQGIPVVVLDRPNPHGHYVDGPVLKTGFTSFIGMHPVALVHGMTMAEYASMINEEGWLAGGVKCSLKQILMKGYTHRTIYALPVNPSPNLQDMDAIYLYPSVCLLEGTVASVGRGTDFPFRLIGHPKVSTGDTVFVPRSIPGKSESPKWLGQNCNGWKLSGSRPDGSSMLDSLDLTWLLRIYNETGAGKEFFTSSFDLLAGTDQLRKQIIEGKTEAEIRNSWQEDLHDFMEMRKKYLLYPE
jgi:uncharacterized protein YbbC (DUF1343 family)